MSERCRGLECISTLFVTVFANFRMFTLLPFSHSRSEYISSTLLPSCLLVSVVGTTTSWLSMPIIVFKAGRRGVSALDREGRVLDTPLGVREEVEELIGL